MARKRKLYDPDGMNPERAAWAHAAIIEFQRITGTDDGDAVCDLLADLMHLCARQERAFGDFDVQLDRARGHFAAETSKEG